MVDIIKIDPSEMPNAGHKTRPEFDAVRALEVGEAIKFPCTWKHGNRGQCSSLITIKSTMGKAKPVTVRCKDGWVYVHRLSEVNNAKA